MLATRAVIPLVLVLLVVPAGAEISIQDPAGDTAINGVPMGEAGAPYDLREITLRQQEAQLVLEIRLETVPAAHDSAEFVVVFQGHGTWMAGYTALPYTNPAPHYRGGFACPATEDGFVNGSQANDCIGLPDWSLEGTTYTVGVPLDFVHATNGTVITDAWAYSEISPYLKGTSRVDVTSKAGDLVILRAAAGHEAPFERLPTNQDAPGPSIWVVLAFTVGLAVRRRSRLSPLR